MRVAWICNKPPKPVVEAANLSGSVVGGWLDSTAKDLLSLDGVVFLVLFLGKPGFEGRVGALTYASFDSGATLSFFEAHLRSFSPDVVHIWGTEAPHSLTAIQAAEQLGLVSSTVVSIQGLVSICGLYHYCEGVPHSVITLPSIGDFLRRTSIAKDRASFISRGDAEKECLRISHHVIGRTEWDKACSLQINPKLKYHHCNESLRDEFYEGKWTIDRVERHSLFVSQCSYSIKGFHYALQALAMLKVDYPDAVLYTTGETVFRNGLRRNLGRTSYQCYIARLIEKLGLRESVVFLGQLDARAMADRYMQTNVFVSASTIENSPNSVGEAMLLGCPVVSSNVGGVSSMLEHEKEGFLYQSSAPYMLAWYVKRLFDDDDLAERLSSAARIRAKETHDRSCNLRRLFQIYESITRGGRFVP